MDRAINFASATGWEKYYDPDVVLNADGTTSNGPKELGWWPSPEAPYAANTANGGQQYRIKVPWNTTGPMTSSEPKLVNGQQEIINGVPQFNTYTLLGHNGAHTALLAKVNGSQSKTLNFVLSDGSSMQDEVADRNVTVGNVVLQNVTTSTGSPYYFKFDRFSEDAARVKPSVSFKIVDTGDPNRYTWKVRIRSTDSETWDGILITGEAVAGATVTAKVNDPDASGQTQADNAGSSYAEISETGTYTFDISVTEIDLWGNPLGDSQSYRSIKLYLPYTMPDTTDAQGQPARGHFGKMVTDAAGIERYYVNYYLRDDTGVATGTQASKLSIEMLPPGMGAAVASNDATWNRTLNNAVQNKLLMTFQPEPRLSGMYITVFTAEDTHKAEYRDHKNRPSLTKNDRAINTPHIYNAKPTTGEDWSRNGDIVVSAKDAALGLPGGEKRLEIEVYPLDSSVTLTLKSKPGMTGSAVFANPDTKAVIGATQTLPGIANDKITNVATRQKLLILGRDVSGAARSMVIEVKNAAGQKISITFDSKDAARKEFDFTVFRVTVNALTSKTLRVDDVLVPSIYSNGGLGPKTLSSLVKDITLTMHTQEDDSFLGHNVINGLCAYGGIVFKGQIVPSSMNRDDFNLVHDRSNAFNWDRRRFTRTYNKDFEFDIKASETEKDLQLKISDDSTDSTNDDAKDLIPNSDGVANNLFIWAADTPNATPSDVPNAGDVVYKRYQFIEEAQYAGVPVSEKMPWYWRAAVQKSQDGKFMQKDQLLLNDPQQPLDNEIKAGAITSLGPTLSATTVPQPTLNEFTPNPLKRGEAKEATITGTHLIDGTHLQYLFQEVVDPNDNNKIKVSVIYFAAQNINANGTVLTGQVTPELIDGLGSYQLKAFAYEKVATLNNATILSTE